MNRTYADFLGSLQEVDHITPHWNSWRGNHFRLKKILEKDVALKVGS